MKNLNRYSADLVNEAGNPEESFDFATLEEAQAMINELKEENKEFHGWFVQLWDMSNENNPVLVSQEEIKEAAKTIVKNLDKGTYGMTANMKKLLVEVVGLNDSKYFNNKMKVNRTVMMIEPLKDNKYKVTEYETKPSILGGTHTTESIFNVELATK